MCCLVVVSVRDPQKRENRPEGNRAANSIKYQAGEPSHSLADIPGLDTMTGRAQRIALAYYESGHLDGYAAGFAAAEAAQAEIERRAAASAGIIARGIPFADLCERRGEPERAEAQRRTLAERGIA